MKKDIRHTQKKQEQKAVVISRIRSFCKQLSISYWMTKAGFKKTEGIPVLSILISILSLVFTGKSFGRAYQDGSEGFRDDTLARFLGNPKHNWRLFLLGLTRCIINDIVGPLTSKKRVRCLIADDSIYARNRSKKVELLAWVYDHCAGLTKRGFRMLALSWTDGFSTFGLDLALLSSAFSKKRIQEITKQVDKRSCGYLRRLEAMIEMPEVLVDMVRRALKWGIRADYLLMDSWFCLPSLVTKIHQLGMNVIGMVKKTSKIHYLYEGRLIDVKKIYRCIRKKRGKAKILTSVIVQLKESGIPVKLVFVRNRNKKKDWLVLISTSVELADEEIVRIYGYRWEIEVLFKMCKHYLRLCNETQTRDFDVMIGHATIVMVRHNFLALERRNESDQRTFGELFYQCNDEVKDLDLYESMKRILSLLIEELRKYSEFSEKIIDVLIESFFNVIDFLYPQIVGQGCET